MNDIALKIKHILEQQDINDLPPIEEEQKDKEKEEKENPQSIEDTDTPPDETSGDTPPDDTQTGSPETPPEQQDQSMGAMGDDVGMGEMPEMEDPNAPPSLEQIGKVYELRQIYDRLIAIRNHLSIFVEDEFDEVKQILSKAIDLFDLVINNYKQYEDKIDSIIILYYNLIKEIYEITKKKYKKYSKNKSITKSPFETNIK